MNKVRIWLKGKRIGLPYDDFSLKNYVIVLSKDQIDVYDKHENVVTVKFFEFIERIEIL